MHVDPHVFEKQPLQQIDPLDRTANRDRQHTTLFLEELARRYPDYQNNRAVTQPLVTRAITLINQNARITPAVVTAGLSAAETALGLVDTAQHAPIPVDDVGQLLDWFNTNHGNFTWQGEPEQNRLGGVSDFRAWLNGAQPLVNLPGPNTQMICWEVVLLAAASVGIYGIAQLRQVYTGNLVGGTFALFSAHGVVDIAENGTGFRVANAIAAGDVIMIKATGAAYDHVVVAAHPDTANARNIEVYSLWNLGTGGVLGRTRLDTILKPEASMLRHAPIAV